MNSKYIQTAKAKPKEDKRRSLSMTSDKSISSKAIAEDEVFGEPTMEELMRMHPLIERKISNIRKKRYLKERNSDSSFPQIQEEDEQGEQKE